MRRVGQGEGASSFLEQLAQHLVRVDLERQMLVFCVEIGRFLKSLGMIAASR